MKPSGRCSISATTVQKVVRTLRSVQAGTRTAEDKEEDIRRLSGEVIFMDTLSPEQQALFASIMGNSSQAKAQSPVIPTQTETPSAPAATAPAADSNRLLSQAEIDALIASMTGN